MEKYPIFKTVKYDNPKLNIIKPERAYDNKKKTLVVLNTYIPEGNISEYNTRSYVDHDYRRYKHDRKECLKFALACYKYYTPGANYDLIIVDNSSPGSIDADVPIYKRENTYYSFGAYKYAWDRFGKDYDYFVFHEFDWVPAKHNWLINLIDYWESDNEIGMIGNLIEHFKYNKNDDGVINDIIKKVAPNREEIYNLDSEYLFTSNVVLNQMEENGGWNIFPCEPEVRETPVVNELGLQQPILEMGYKLACMNDGEHTMFYAIYNSGFPRNDKWFYGLDKLSPFVPEQTRNFVPEMNNYFSWYTGKSSFVSWT